MIPLRPLRRLRNHRDGAERRRRLRRRRAAGRAKPEDQDRFGRIGAAAHDADDRIIYNGQTGALLYDAHGTGAIAAIQIANVGPSEGLTTADFLVI